MCLRAGMDVRAVVQCKAVPDHRMPCLFIYSLHDVCTQVHLSVLSNRLYVHMSTAYMSVYMCVRPSACAH